MIPPLGGKDTAIIDTRNSGRSLQTRDTREVFRRGSQFRLGRTETRPQGRVSEIGIGCGGRIRTADLRVMSRT